ELIEWHDVEYQPPGLCRIGVKIVAGKSEIARSNRANQHGEILAESPGWNDADPRMRISEAGIIGSHDDVAIGNKLETSGNGITIDRSDSWLGQAGESLHHRTIHPDLFRSKRIIFKLLEIRS